MGAAHRLHLIDAAAHYPPHAGGIENYAFELHGALLDAFPDLRITVLTSATAGAPERERLGDRWRVVRWRAMEPVPPFVLPGPAFPALLRGVLSEHPGAQATLLTHTRFFVHGYPAGRIAQKAGARWVHLEHGSGPVQSGGLAVRTAATLVDDAVGKRILRRADALAAVSAASSEWIGRFCGRQAAVLYRGIPARAAVTGRAPHAGSAFRAVFVGRLIAGKGVADLLQAMASSVTPVELVVVGDGPDRASLEQLAARLGLSARVRFLGVLDNASALEQVAAADVFVNPSLTEGLPTTVLEAAAMGVPVVATDVGGTREVLTGCADQWLVPARDPAALGRAIDRIAGDPEGARRCADGLRTRSHEVFSWERTAARFAELAGW